MLGIRRADLSAEIPGTIHNDFCTAYCTFGKFYVLYNNYSHIFLLFPTLGLLTISISGYPVLHMHGIYVSVVWHSGK